MKHSMVVMVLVGLFFGQNAYSAVKEVVYSGQEVELNTNKDHKTTVIFPEAIKGIVRGYGADQKDYLIIRNDLDAKVLELMPLASELAEITAVGVSGEQYVLKMLYKEDFHTKVTILPLKTALGNVQSVVKELNNLPLASLKKNEKIVVDIEKKDIPQGIVAIKSNDKPLGTHLSFDGLVPDQDKGVVQESVLLLPAELNVKITLKGNGLPLKIFLAAIGKATGYNVISTPEIDGKKASINLEDIEVWRALKSLLYPFGYGFKVSKEDLIISTSETRTFAIAVPAVEQSFSDVTSNESYTNQVSSSNGSTTGNTASQDIKVGTKILLENRSPSLSLWNDLENNIKTMVTPGVGQYSLNKVAGMVVVTDLPGVLDKIQDFVDSVNASLKRQASFEIQIVEVALVDERQTGIDWNALSNNIYGLKNITADTSFSSAGFSSGQLLTLKASTSNSTTNNLSAILKALETMGRVEIVSRPSITVSNMIPAIIQEGTSVGYISGIGDTYNNNVTTSNVTTSQVHGGLTMRLVAKIGEKGENMILNISTAVTTIDSIDTVKSGNGTVQTPQVSNKSITTNVSVSEGKTLIIGGLISTTKADSHNGVPGISRVPVIGNAFKYRNRKSNKVELVIVITPKIGEKN